MDNPRYDYELAVVKKDDNKLIGACGIHLSNLDNREGWIGYCYHQQYWGNVYATEATKAIIKFGVVIVWSMV